MTLVKSHLNYVDGKDQVVPEKGPSYLGVDETSPMIIVKITSIMSMAQEG